MSTKDRIRQKRRGYHPHYQRLLVHAHAFLFRISRGRLGGHFEKAPILLLTTRGYTTTRLRTVPLPYLFLHNQLVVIAYSRKAGHTPGWWRNLQQEPTGFVEIGKKIATVRATEASEQEQTLLWTLFRHRYPEYTRRLIHLQADTPFVYLHPLRVESRRSTEREHEE